MLNYKCLLFLCFIFCQTGFSQNLDLKLYPPEMQENLRSAVDNQYEMKVKSIFSQAGVFNDKESVIGVYPSLMLLEEGEIEGISKMKVVYLEMGLSAKNTITGETVYTFTNSISGTGTNINAAVKKAVQSIKSHQGIYKNMLSQLEDRYRTYYDENCVTLHEEAEYAVSQEDFPRAISLLNAIPKSTLCYQSTKARLLAIHQKYQEQACAQFILEAEKAIAQQKFNDAVDALSKIDASSPCATKTKELLAVAGEGIEAQENAKFDFLNQVYQNKIKLEASRNKAMEEISTEYLKKNKK